MSRPLGLNLESPSGSGVEGLAPSGWHCFGRPWKLPEVGVAGGGRSLRVSLRELHRPWILSCSSFWSTMIYTTSGKHWPPLTELPCLTSYDGQKPSKTISRNKSSQSIRYFCLWWCNDSKEIGVGSFLHSPDIPVRN